MGTDGLTVMHRLAWIEDSTVAAKMFELLYSKVPELVDNPGNAGVTPLWMCVDRINAPVADLLVSKGADPKKAPDGPQSSALASLKQRIAEEPNLASDLKTLAAAMKVQ